MEALARDILKGNISVEYLIKNYEPISEEYERQLSFFKKTRVENDIVIAIANITTLLRAQSLKSDHKKSVLNASKEHRNMQPWLMALSEAITPVA